MYRRLLSNTVLFSVSTVGSKILLFLLTPFYTSILTDAEYGVTDLIIQTGNVLIPLLIGLGMLWLVDHQRQNLVLCALGLLGGLAVSSFCDWGIIGPLMILLFWHFHDRPRGVALAMLVPFLSLGLPALSWAVSDPALLSLGVLGYYTVGFGLATALMLNYNGQRGRPLKWFFYGYYPGHLLALWALAQALAL